MTAEHPTTVRLHGREYPCYCKAPVSELKALPEPEFWRAWNHIKEHTAKRSSAQ